LLFPPFLFQHVQLATFIENKRVLWDAI
jgi:hypothetical protein